MTLKDLSTIPPQTIYMGWHTDPYQPCEAECRQTRRVLELLLQKGFSASILTKSDLVLRDMDLLQQMNAASVSVSVAFNDNGVRRLFEANTIATEARVAALEQLRAAGIRTSALVCPVIPYITDVIPLIDMLASHTDRIWIYGLSMRSRSDQGWQNVERIVEDHFPDLNEPLASAVFSQDNAYWTDMRGELVRLQEERNLNLNIHL